jgi:hypothetical protein
MSPLPVRRGEPSTLPLRRSINVDLELVQPALVAEADHLVDEELLLLVVERSK